MSTSTVTVPSPSLFLFQSPSATNTVSISYSPCPAGDTSQLVPCTPPLNTTLNISTNSGHKSSPNNIARVPDVGNTTSLLRKVLSGPTVTQKTISSPLPQLTTCNSDSDSNDNKRLCCRVPTTPHSITSSITPEQVVPKSNERKFRWSPPAGTTLQQCHQRTLPTSIKNGTKILQLFHDDTQIFASREE